jgi:hypothetical protein
MDRKKLVERLSKVRRLARESPEENERKAGEGRLQEMLKKHSITEADLDAFDRKARRPSPMPPPWPHSPFTVVIVPGEGFGSVFAAMFGGGFSFHVNPGTGSSSTTTDSSWGAI